MCSLRFENNLLTIEGIRFASISKKTPISKLSFAFVSLALPLLHETSPIIWKGKLATVLVKSREMTGRTQNIPCRGTELSKTLRVMVDIEGPLI